MAKINTRNERPRTLDMGGVIIETGYFRTWYDIETEQGDTLTSIAKETGIGVRDLYESNRQLIGENYDLDRQLTRGLKFTYSTRPHRGIEIIM